MRRLDSLLLTGVGVLLVHQSAYTVSSLAGYKAAVTHGHLETAWLLGSLATIGALAVGLLFGCAPITPMPSLPAPP